MKRRVIFVLGTLVVVALVVAAMLSMVSAAPACGPACEKVFAFTKTIGGNPTVTRGDVFTVTLTVNPLPELDSTQPFTITDPNTAYPGYFDFEVIPETAPAVYDSVTRAIVWHGTVSPSSAAQSIQFRVRVRPDAPIVQTQVLTNVAYVGIDPTWAGSLLPGSLPGSLPPWDPNLPAGTQGAAWDVFTVVPPSCIPVQYVSMTWLPDPPTAGQGVVFTAGYYPPDATAPSLSWDWGDGLTGSGSPESHVYAAGGTYTATVTASNGCSSISRPRAVTVLAGATGVITDTGGTLVYTDTTGSGVAIDIPAGAVSGTVTLVMAGQDLPTSTVPGANMNFAGVSFSLDAYEGVTLLPGFVFDQPVVLTVRYTDADVANVDENTLKLYYWGADNAWHDAATSCSPASTYTYHPESNNFSVPICHLSRFGVFGTNQVKLYLPVIDRNLLVP